ncbi:MAG: putative transporter small subunit [Pseudomonadota bacterium]
MLTLYILMWPIIAAVVLVIIVYSFIRDLRQARREGKKVV